MSIHRFALVLGLLSLGASAGAEEAPKAFEGRDTAAVKKAFPSDDRDLVEQAESVTLCALHPYPESKEGKAAKPEDAFQGYRILGQAAVTDVKERRTLVEAVYKGLNAQMGPPAGCFNPRHGLRFVKGKRTIDLVLCYQCETLYAHSTSHTDGRAILRIAKSAEGPLDAALANHKLPKHKD